jgi:hypothetical protein
MKDDLDLNSRSNIFADQKGNLYAGDARGKGGAVESLHMNLNGGPVR